MSKTISILGSTGSIGTQALDVIRRCHFSVAALTANTQVDLLAEQAREFHPKLVVIADEAKYAALRTALADTDIRVSCGMDGLCEAAAIDDADIVCNALVGMVGIQPTAAAITAGKTVALANKETIVSAGEWILPLAKSHGVEVLPVDSEHSAFFQCMLAGAHPEIRKLFLTASGGPFFGYSKEQLHAVSYEQALTHPNWSMGRKITVDCATLMNKGLELIEAVRLFHVAPETIEILIHRESIVHAMVEWQDATVSAIMSTPSMELPIQYALTWPDRKEIPSASISFPKLGTLSFYAPDTEVFSSLQICRKAADLGGIAPTLLNGANEAAVELFLQKKISFSNLLYLIEGFDALLHRADQYGRADTLSDILAADAAARAYILELAAGKGWL